MTTADARLLAACLLLQGTDLGTSLEGRVAQEKAALERVQRLEALLNESKGTV